MAEYLLGENVRRRNERDYNNVFVPDLRKIGGHVAGLLLAPPSTAPEASILRGVPRIYAAMQRDGDTSETALIRDRLLDPGLAPLPLEALTRERAELQPLFDRIKNVENDPNYEAALRLAAHGLFVNYTLYGDPAVGEVNQIVGSFEKPDYGVRAFYHNAFDILQDGHDLQTHFDNLGSEVSTADRLDGLVADIFTDIVYGWGREKNSPGAFDELLSANLLFSYAMQLGYPPVRAARLRRIILETRFDEGKKSQPGRYSDDLVVQGVTAVDLQTLARSGDGVPSSQDIVLENLMSDRWHESRVLGQAVKMAGVTLRTRTGGMAFIHKNKEMGVKGHPTATTLGGAYVGGMLESANFHENYVPPKKWTLDSPKARKENADAIREEAFALAV